MQLNVILSPELHDRMTAHCSQVGVSKAAFVRDAIEQAMVRQAATVPLPRVMPDGRPIVTAPEVTHGQYSPRPNEAPISKWAIAHGAAEVAAQRSARLLSLADEIERLQGMLSRSAALGSNPVRDAWERDLKALHAEALALLAPPVVHP